MFGLFIVFGSVLGMGAYGSGSIPSFTSQNVNTSNYITLSYDYNISVQDLQNFYIKPSRSYFTNQTEEDASNQNLINCQTYFSGHYCYTNMYVSSNFDASLSFIVVNPTYRFYTDAITYDEYNLLGTYMWTSVTNNQHLNFSRMLSIECNFEEGTYSDFIRMTCSMNIYLLPFEYFTMDENPTSYQEGYEYGVSVGKELGGEEGYNRGFQDGVDSVDVNGLESSAYAAGEQHGIEIANQYTFGSLFGSIADTPIMIIRKMLSFEVFGITAYSILFSMIAAVLALFVIRKFF